VRNRATEAGGSPSRAKAPSLLEPLEAAARNPGTWHGGPDDFWDDTARRMQGYTRDCQGGQRLRLELWCEAAGIAPQLARVADRYSVPVYSPAALPASPPFA